MSNPSLPLCQLVTFSDLSVLDKAWFLVFQSHLHHIYVLVKIFILALTLLHF